MRKPGPEVVINPDDRRSSHRATVRIGSDTTQFRPEPKPTRTEVTIFPLKKP